MDLDIFALGPLGTNCFLLSDAGKAMVVDPGGNPAPVVAKLQERGAELTHILNTHLHFDHTAGNAALSRATGAPVLASDDDAYLLETELGAGGFMGLPKIEPFAYQNLEPGEQTFLGLTCRVLATPGHSPGSLTFYFPDLEAAFVGDVLFYRSIGRTDFPGGDSDTLLNTVRQKIFTLPPQTVVYSGHGQQTTVGDEMNHNPFFSGTGF